MLTTQRVHFAPCFQRQQWRVLTARATPLSSKWPALLISEPSCLCKSGLSCGVDCPQPVAYRTAPGPHATLYTTEPRGLLIWANTLCFCSPHIPPYPPALKMGDWMERPGRQALTPSSSHRHPSVHWASHSHLKVTVPPILGPPALSRQQGAYLGGGRSQAGLSEGLVLDQMCAAEIPQTKAGLPQVPRVALGLFLPSRGRIINHLGSHSTRHPNSSNNAYSLKNEGPENSAREPL